MKSAEERAAEVLNTLWANGDGGGPTDEALVAAALHEHAREAVARAVAEERLQCELAAQKVADDYDEAMERFYERGSSVARKYSDMHDGAMAAVEAIRARGQAAAPEGGRTT